MPEAANEGMTPADESSQALVEVRYTANFEANLQSIEAFWTENKFPRGYDCLLDELVDTVVTNLERHPRMGRPFMSRHGHHPTGVLCPSGLSDVVFWFSLRGLDWTMPTERVVLMIDFVFKRVYWPLHANTG